MLWANFRWSVSSVITQKAKVVKLNMGRIQTRKVAGEGKINHKALQIGKAEHPPTYKVGIQKK